MARIEVLISGYVRTQVVVSDKDIDSPVVENPDFFCAMSKAAYQKFSHMVDRGILIYDPGFVEPDESLPCHQIAISARELSAEHFGKELFANMILYGYLIQKLNGKIDREKALEAMEQRIPRALEENKKAFELGFSFKV